MWTTITTGERIFRWRWTRQRHERSSHLSWERYKSCRKSAAYITIMSDEQLEGTFPKSSVFKRYGFSGRTLVVTSKCPSRIGDRGLFPKSLYVTGGDAGLGPTGITRMAVPGLGSAQGSKVLVIHAVRNAPLTDVAMRSG